MTTAGPALDERHLSVVRDGVSRGPGQGPGGWRAGSLRGLQQRVSRERVGRRGSPCRGSGGSAADRSRSARSRSRAAAGARHAPLLGSHRGTPVGTCAAGGADPATRRSTGGTCSARRFTPGTGGPPSAGRTGRTGRASCAGRRGARPADGEPAPSGESVHGAGSEAEGAPTRAGPRVGSGGVPSGETPAGVA